MKVLVSVSLLCLSVAASGCATSGGAGSDGTDPDVLTRAQIIESGTQNTLDAVRRLRPAWLPRQRRSYVEIGVIDGSRGERPVSQGRINEGQGIGGDAGEAAWWRYVSEMRYLRGAAAAGAMDGCSGRCVGVILVHLGGGGG